MSAEPNSLAVYRETIERAVVLREKTYIDARETICGIEIRQITPRMFALLDVVKSPFIHRQRLPNVGDVVQFLWVLSPSFQPGNGLAARWRRRRFTKRCRGIKYVSALSEIDCYMEDQLQDKQGGSAAKSDIAPAGFVASIVHRIATAYGWQERVITDTPIIRLLQYLKLIDMANGKPFCWNPGDRERGEYLRSINQQARVE